MRPFYYLFILILFNCKPSSSIIRNELDLNRSEYRQIKNNDSVLNLLSKNLKERVSKKRLKRRLDSFYQNKYSNKELLVILKLEYIFRNDKNPNFELDRTMKPGEGFNMEGVDDGKKFMDSLVSKTLGMPKKD